jgi:hypothetical protein
MEKAAAVRVLFMVHGGGSGMNTASMLIADMIWSFGWW